MLNGQIINNTKIGRKKYYMYEFIARTKKKKKIVYASKYYSIVSQSVSDNDDFEQILFFSFC